MPREPRRDPIRLYEHGNMRHFTSSGLELATCFLLKRAIQRVLIDHDDIPFARRPRYQLQAIPTKSCSRNKTSRLAPSITVGIPKAKKAVAFDDFRLTANCLDPRAQPCATMRPIWEGRYRARAKSRARRF